VITNVGAIRGTHARTQIWSDISSRCLDLLIILYIKNIYNMCIEIPSRYDNKLSLIKYRI